MGKCKLKLNILQAIHVIDAA